MKDWFKRGKSSTADAGPTIDDLIVLERYEEAEAALKNQLKKTPRDLRLHLQLGSVLAQLRKVDEALAEFYLVADAYNRDGFQDKAIALMNSARKIAPDDPQLLARIQRSQQDKELARLRNLAVDALKEASRSETGRVATAAIELEQIWDRLAKTDFVRQMPVEQVKPLFARFKVQRLRADQTLVGRGEQGAALMLVSGGEIEARVASPNGPLAVRSFPVGAILGDSVLFQRTAWPADLVATHTGSVLVLSREGLEQALQGNPDPKGLLDLLRAQGNDQGLLQAIAKLEHTG